MQLESLGLFAGYFALKLAAYSAWCVLGVRLFRPERAARLGLGIRLGFLRLALGLGFGVLIFFVGMWLFLALDRTDAFGTTAMTILTYLAVYVPVRWVEWGIVEALLRPDSRGPAVFVLGADRAGRRWRLGGALVSCVADVPVMLAFGGLPVGRFLC